MAGPFLPQTDDQVAIGLDRKNREDWKIDRV